MSSQQTRNLVLTIASDTRSGTAHLALAERAVVGRVSEGDSNPPDLDLTAYGGAANGVSRLHAAFWCEGDHVYIEDLGSTSGTRINGLALPPNQKCRLRSQDELEFGRVRVTVRL